MSWFYPFLVFFLGDATVRPPFFVKCLTMYVLLFFLGDDGSDCVAFLIALLIVWGVWHGDGKGGVDSGTRSVSLTFLQ